MGGVLLEALHQLKARSGGCRQWLGKGVRGKPAHFKAFIIGDAGLRIAVFAWLAEEQQVHVLALVAVGVGDHIRGRLHAYQAYGLDVDACLLEGFPHAGIGRFFGRFHDAVDERPLPGVGTLAQQDAALGVLHVGGDAGEP